MKAATIALGFIAAVNAYTPHQKFHFRRQNSTAPLTSAGVSAGASGAAPIGTGVASVPSNVLDPAATDPASLTTLTVTSTNIRTITSCAATITNCPANPTDIAALPTSAQSLITVTDTVALTVTVCPVSEASSIASSVLSEASTGGIVGSTIVASATAPLITSVSASIVEAGTTTIPLTFTQGAPGSETIITTTVRSVVQSTIYVTVVKTGSAPAGAAPTAGSPGNEGGDAAAGTTTRTTTSVGTKYVTIKTSGSTVLSTETASPVAGGGSGSGSPGSGSDAGAGNCPGAVTVTLPAVTVTLPASTVFVTLGADATAAPVSPGGTNNADAPPAAEESDSACPPEVVVTETADPVASPTDVVVVDVTATVMPAPYPTGNGTDPIGTGISGVAQPTGALKARFRAH